MPITRYFTGFETGHLQASSGFAVIQNPNGFVSVQTTTRRTGAHALRVNKTSLLTGAFVQFPLTGLKAFPAGNEAGGLLRFFLRLGSYPSALNEIAFWRGSGTGALVVMHLQTNGTFRVYVTGQTSAFSTTAIPLNTWVECQLGCFIHNDTSAWAIDDYVVGTLTILGQTVSAVVDGTQGFSTGGPADFDLPPVQLGDEFTGATVDYFFDDLFYIADSQVGVNCDSGGAGAPCRGSRGLANMPTIQLPTQTKVWPVKVIGQGASAEWVGAYTLVNEDPFDPTAGASEQTSAVSGASTTFTHDAAGGVNIRGLHVIAMAKAAAGPHAILWDGVEYSVTVPAVYTTTVTPNVTIWGDIAAIQTKQYGFRNKTGVAVQLGAIIGEALADSLAAEVTFPSGEAIEGLTWVELTDKAGTVHVWAKVALPDPATYFQGYKEDRVIRWGQIRRALSDRNGQYEGTDFSWVVSDFDRKIRGLLGAESTRYFPNRPVTVRMIADPDRRLLKTPRTVVKGLVRDYRPLSQLHFEFTAQDILASKFSAANDKDQIPRRVITRDDFPDAPDDVINLPVPIIYGRVSDEDKVIGTAAVTAPTLSAVVVGPAGTATYEYVVTAIDQTGPDPFDFSQRANHKGETGPSNKVTVTNAPTTLSVTNYVKLTWTDPSPAGATKFYRIYGRYTNFQLSLLDVAVPAIDGLEYHDGERNGRTEVDVLKTDSIPPAASNSTQSAAIGQVPLIFVGTEIIASVTWGRFLLCGHAVKAIENAYLDGIKVADAAWGVDALAPGKPGWPFGTNYRDLNGRRYTLLYGKGPALLRNASVYPPPKVPQASEVRPTAVNVKGIETVGDSTGTLITDVVLQYRHALVNWILQSYQAGAWLTTPVFPDDAALTQVDEGSFDTASATAQTRILGGYVGGFVLGNNGERLTIRDLIARVNVSADVDSGFNRKTQFFVSMANEAIAAITGAVSLTDVLDIFSGSFDIEDRVSDLFNAVPYVYERDYVGRVAGQTTIKSSGWGVDATVSDAVSIANFGETKTAPRAELHLIRDAATADDIAQRRLLRTKEPPRLVKLRTGLRGVSIELGDILKLSHYEGITTTGWVDRAVRVIRHETDPETFSVALECVDMERLFGSSVNGGGPLILGDETALPASWPATTAAQKAYGYLADEGTGAFSDGKFGKHLR